MGAEIDRVGVNWDLDPKIDLKWANISKVTKTGNTGAEQNKAPTLAHILMKSCIRLKLL